MSDAPSISRVMLGRKLRFYRDRAELNVAQAARKTGISETKLRKFERGVNEAIKLPDLYAYTAVYGLTSKESTHLIELAEKADSHGWYHDYDVPTEFAQFIELESISRRIRVYEQQYINGLFQTEDYIAALRTNWIDKRPDPQGGLRIQRQEAILNQANPPEFTYVTSESALRCDVGGRAVMADQIQHLLKLASRPNISIAVLPFAIGAHPNMTGSYSIMYFPDGLFPTTVYLESLHGSRYEDAGKIVTRYEEAFEQTCRNTIAVPIKEFVDDSNLLA